MVFGIVMGVYSALRRDGLLAKTFQAISLIGISLPTFLIGILLIYLFSVTLGWLPSFGRGEVVRIGWWSTGLLTLSGLKALILPSIGRDMLSAVLYGLRISLVVGLLGVALSGAIGILLGLIAGYVGGAVDSVIMRIADVQLTFPAILIALLVNGIAKSAFGNRLDAASMLGVLVLAIGLSFWVQYARTVRSSVLVEKNGGQRQRIAIARALSSEAEFIVCDEPTSALDVSVQAQILNLMRDLQDRFGLTYLFISHNLAVVRHMASRIGVMYLGRIVELADSRELFSRPRMPYTRMLLGAVPDLTMSGRQRIPVRSEIPNPIDPPKGCAFNPRCPLAFDLCHREAPELIDGVACHAINTAPAPA